MPMIYKRFTEKTAEEWRQIYKVHLPVATSGSSLTVTGPPTARVPDQERLRKSYRRCPIPPLPHQDVAPIPLH
jgi:hypothetical protein